MATKKNTNRRAAMAMARETWDGLSPTMQGALYAAVASCGRRLECGTVTGSALARRELAEDYFLPGLAKLTPWGLMVREAGLAARAEGQR